MSKVLLLASLSWVSPLAFAGEPCGCPGPGVLFPTCPGLRPPSGDVKLNSTVINKETGYLVCDYQSSSLKTVEIPGNFSTQGEGWSSMGENSVYSGTGCGVVAG